VTAALRFLTLTAERRALAFEQAAATLAASSVMIWVCWMLTVPFGDTMLAPHFVFKGGTPLSKVFGVIDRFSEDIGSETRTRLAHRSAAHGPASDATVGAAPDMRPMFLTPPPVFEDVLAQLAAAEQSLNAASTA
jgi:hypothetical protein